MNQLEKNNTPLSENANNLQTGQIEIKAYPDDNGEIAFSIKTVEVRIDWGDGNIDSFFSNGYGKIYNHLYSNKNLQIIKVDTYRMTEFYTDFDGSAGTFCKLRFDNCPNLYLINCNKQSLSLLEIDKAESMFYLGCTENQLTSLDVSNCTALTFLDCWGNQLSSLDVSKCTALNLLQCFDNKLSESALNSLFNSLPKRDPDNKGMITCGGEYNACDKIIAESKGWSVQLFLEKTIFDDEYEDNLPF